MTAPKPQPRPDTPPNDPPSSPPPPKVFRIGRPEQRTWLERVKAGALLLVGSVLGGGALGGTLALGVAILGATT